MKRVRALVEGHTEQAFVTQVLAPHLTNVGIHAFATLFGKPGRFTGGIRSYSAARRDIIAALKQDVNAYSTTMVDFYGLPGDWPGREEAKSMAHVEIGPFMEAQISEDIARTMGPSFRSGRFIPYVQMYEFEALLFADTSVLAKTLQRPDLEKRFDKIVASCGSPEEIDDDPKTAPSKRISSLAPNFNKVLHGSTAAGLMGIDTIRSKCPRFSQWLERLEALAQES